MILIPTALAGLTRAVGRLGRLEAFAMVAVLGVGCLSGCEQEGAGVLVRWRFIDGLTGIAPAGSTTAGSYFHAKVGTEELVIDRVRLRTEIVGDDGTLTEQSCQSCCFHPDPNEWTTRFELPAHTYKLTVEAYACGQRIGQTPAPLVRTLGPGDMANMQAQSITLYPGDSVDPATQKPRCTDGRPPPTTWPAPPSECSEIGSVDGGTGDLANGDTGDLANADASGLSDGDTGDLAN